MIHVIGIDPGTDKSAVVVISESAVDKLLSIAPIGIMELDAVVGWLREYKSINNNPVVAVEWVQSYGMSPGASTFLTCKAVGHFERVAKDEGMSCVLHSRPKIKAWITGSARAKDKDVRQALMMRFGGTKKGEPLHGIKTHLWSALAVAVYEMDGAKLGGWNDETPSVKVRESMIDVLTKGE